MESSSDTPSSYRALAGKNANLENLVAAIKDATKAERSARRQEKAQKSHTEGKEESSSDTPSSYRAPAALRMLPLRDTDTDP